MVFGGSFDLGGRLDIVMIRAGVWCCGRDVVVVRYVGRIALMRGEGWG